MLGRIHIEIKKDWIINAFRTCGLFPWNPGAINYEGLNITSVPDDLRNDDEIPEHPALVELRNMISDNATFEVIDQFVDQSPDPPSDEVINDNFLVENNQSEPVDISSIVCPVSNHQTPHQNEPYLNISENTEPQGSASISFRRAKAFYSTESPYTKSLRILGPDLVREFEDPNFLQELENKKKLYQIHIMLKEAEEERLKPLSLPQHTKPKRKGRLVQKRHFVSVSEEYIDVMEQRKRKKNDEEEAKKIRKIARDKKKIQKENVVPIKIEPDVQPVMKRRGRPKKPNILKENNVIECSLTNKK